MPIFPDIKKYTANRVAPIYLTCACLMLLAFNAAASGTEGRGPGSDTQATPTHIDLQGHRGARGLLPENTIPAFLKALDIGVDTLEMDVVVDAEGYLVVSHDPWMSAKICSHADGSPVTKREEKSLRIYAMSDAQVASFDCGSHGHPDFPKQKALAVSKPMLDAVLDAVATQVARTGHTPPLFNIEIKSRPEWERVFHPPVDVYADILYNTLKAHGVLARTTIQSFDPRALEATHQLDASIAIALLVDNRRGLRHNLDRLSFTPSIYSPNYHRLSMSMVADAHAQHIRVIPWTVDDEKSMKKLLKWGVDGLITDYPDLAVKVLAGR